MIGKKVLISVYSCQKAPSIAKFRNKLDKKVTIIIKAARWPFLDRKKDKQLAIGHVSATYPALNFGWENKYLQ